jgi:hypothetical protein
MSAAVPAPTHEMTDSMGVAPDGTGLGTAEVTVVLETVSVGEGGDPVVVFGGIGVMLGCDVGVAEQPAMTSSAAARTAIRMPATLAVMGPTRRT